MYLFPIVDLSVLTIICTFISSHSNNLYESIEFKCKITKKPLNPEVPKVYALVCHSVIEFYLG